MMCTIMIGRHSSVQGQFVARMPDGRIMVRVGARFFTGWPVNATAELEVAGAA